MNTEAIIKRLDNSIDKLSIARLTEPLLAKKMYDSLITSMLNRKINLQKQIKDGKNEL